MGFVPVDGFYLAVCIGAALIGGFLALFGLRFYVTSSSTVCVCMDVCLCACVLIPKVSLIAHALLFWLLGFRCHIVALTVLRLLLRLFRHGADGVVGAVNIGVHLAGEFERTTRPVILILTNCYVINPRSK